MSTIAPVTNFNPEADAEVLRKAMKGLGTDEKAIISIIGTRTNAQLKQVEIKFKAAFGKDLKDDLKSEISHNFLSAVLARLQTPTEYDVWQLHHAMAGAGTNEKTLIEILCSRSNSEIKAIREEYKKEHNKDLEKEITSETSGHFRRLLVSLLQGNRDESKTVDHNAAVTEAKALYDAGEGKWGTDESKFNQILVLRSPTQLHAIFDEYQKLTKHTIQKAIDSEFSGDIKAGLQAIVSVTLSPAEYFAEVLYHSMKGLGTDDNTLVRAIVTRCEVDMVQIKEAFQKKYGKSLGSFIEGDCSGDYKKLMLALVGEKY